MNTETINMILNIVCAVLLSTIITIFFILKKRKEELKNNKNWLKDSEKERLILSKKLSEHKLIINNYNLYSYEGVCRLLNFLHNTEMEIGEDKNLWINIAENGANLLFVKEIKDLMGTNDLNKLLGLSHRWINESIKFYNTSKDILKNWLETKNRTFPDLEHIFPILSGSWFFGPIKAEWFPGFQKKSEELTDIDIKDLRQKIETSLSRRSPKTIDLELLYMEAQSLLKILQRPIISAEYKEKITYSNKDKVFEILDIMSSHKNKEIAQKYLNLIEICDTVFKEDTTKIPAI